MNASSASTTSASSSTEQPEVEDSISLPWSLRILFAVNGASLQLPSLALLSIVNDRAAIPPTYLPVYGAIAFLPYSLKPLYAILTNAIAGGKREDQRHGASSDRLRLLLAVMLGLNGFALIGTDLFVPANGIIACFAWGLLRGLASSWPDFLLGLTVIETAQRRAKKTIPGLWSYEACASVFQSQAATARKVGSLLASVATFILFLVRHFQRVEDPLSPQVVTVLLFGTALLNLLGSAVAMFHHDTDADDHVTCSPDNSCVQTPVRSREIGSYQAIEREETLVESPEDILVIESSQQSPATALSKQSLSISTSVLCDIMALVFLQALLMLSALHRPIVSLSSTAAWVSSIVVAGVGLVAALVASCACVDNDSTNQDTDMGELLQHSTIVAKQNACAIPPKRLALFLMVRHTIPIAGMLMYSYIYAIFAAEPLFLQVLSIVESGVSTIAAFVYERYFSKAYHTGWKMLGLIAVLSIVSGLVSLLDLTVVHATVVGGQVTAQIRWLVLFVICCTYFMGQIGYLPMMVLATTNVVNSGTRTTHTGDERPQETPPDDERDGGSGSVREEGSEVEMTSSAYEEEDTTRAFPFQQAARGSPVYDESMQYASFLSCIDFGAQIGDWIAVPIIASLDITRENNWNNLDKFIIICALGRIASTAFLLIIRPPSGTPYSNGHVF